MMAESSSILQKEEENMRGTNNIDRISSLPDSVLIHILSFLPTKTCVETSLLSRRWRRVWENIQVLDFCDDSHDFYYEFELFKRFAVFVNGMLTLRKSRNIQKMRLSCGHTHEDMFYANSIGTWVRAAIGPELQELDLTLYSNDGFGFVVPSTLFTCTKLISLRLSGGIHIHLRNSSKVYLPSLKMLQLDIDTIDSMNSLLSGCPNLETMEVSFSPTFVSKVHMPDSLKSLKFVVHNNIGIQLEINAPGLKYLSITQKFTCAPICGGNLPNVAQVFLDVYSAEEPVDTLCNLLQAVSRTSIIELRRATVKWLLRAPELEFPEFCNLVNLDLVLPSFNANFMLNVLGKCPVVQSLIITIANEPTFFRTWVHPSIVPRCLVSELGFIYIRGFQGREEEMEFVAYLLRRGIVLKTLVIVFGVYVDERIRHQIMKKLYDVPKSSNMCHLKFV